MQPFQPSEYVTISSAGAGRPLTILLAQESSLERDALARVIAIERPGFSTVEGSPDMVDEIIVTAAPDVMIYDGLTRLAEPAVSVWIHLNVDDSAFSVICVHGERTIVTDLGLAGILDTLDGASSVHVLS